MRGQAGRGVGSVFDETADDEAVVVVEGVCRAVRVHLLFVVAPAMVADFMAEVVVDGRFDVE